MKNESLELGDVQARQVGNAVFLEHGGQSGDVASWGMPDATSAAFVAGQITRILDAFRESLAELETTADKLSDCWLWIDTAARLQDGGSIDILRKSAERLLRKHQCPGWKDATVSNCMNCGMCESCIDRSIAAAEEHEPDEDFGDDDLDDDGNPHEDCETCGNTGWVVEPAGMQIMCGECNN